MKIKFTAEITRHAWHLARLAAGGKEGSRAWFGWAMKETLREVANTARAMSDPALDGAGTPESNLRFAIMQLTLPVAVKQESTAPYKKKTWAEMFSPIAA